MSCPTRCAEKKARMKAKVQAHHDKVRAKIRENRKRFAKG